MTPHLAELFAIPISSARVRYIEYCPGESLIVQYDARTSTSDAAVVEAHAIASPQGWHLRAYPDDPALPLLRCDAAQLADELGLPGGAVVERLAWVPGRRAVLRSGDVVVKLYAGDDELQRARWALGAVADVLPTAGLLASRPDRGAVAQQALAGLPLGRDDATRSVGRAANILRQLHGAVIDELPDLRPRTLLAAAVRPAALAAFAVPELAERIERLVDQLTATIPIASDVVPVHGDFNIGQLLRDGDRTWVIDVDTLALGSPSVDLAAYAANMHNGRTDDDQAVRATLAKLVDAYGRTPEDLMWHLVATMLRRIDRPLRRLKKRWPERTEAVVVAIEDLSL